MLSTTEIASGRKDSTNVKKSVDIPWELDSGTTGLEEKGEEAGVMDNDDDGDKGTLSGVSVIEDGDITILLWVTQKWLKTMIRV